MPQHIQIHMTNGSQEIKQISVELKSDTLGNLNNVSDALGISRIELIRRGSEVAVLLGGSDTSEASELLLESLHENETLLSSDRIDRIGLNRNLARSAYLAAALCSISLINNGREESNVLNAYFRALLLHSTTILDPKFAFDKSNMETIRQDVLAFANVLKKIKDIVSSSSEMRGKAVEQERNEQRNVPANKDHKMKKLQEFVQDQTKMIPKAKSTSVRK